MIHKIGMGGLIPSDAPPLQPLTLPRADFFDFASFLNLKIKMLSAINLRGEARKFFGGAGQDCGLR
jgi:hypothetical protein